MNAHTFTGKRDTEAFRVRAIFRPEATELASRIRRALQTRGYTDITAEKHAANRYRPLLRPGPNTRIFARPGLNVQFTLEPAGGVLGGFVSVVGIRPWSGRPPTLVR